MTIETDYYRLVPHKNILHIETFNAWDENIIADYINDIRTIALAHYSDIRWAMLVDRRNWGLVTPEAGKLYMSIAGNIPLTPLSHAAVVTGNSELKKWIINDIGRKSRTVSVSCFDSVQEAVDWLASFDYHTDSL